MSGGRFSWRDAAEGKSLDELWRDLVAAENQFHAARMRLFSSDVSGATESAPVGRIAELVGRALTDPGERETALRLLRDTSILDSRLFLPQLVDIAWNVPRDLPLVQDLVRSMDEGWLAGQLARISQVVLEKEPPYTEQERQRVLGFLRQLDPRVKA